MRERLATLMIDHPAATAVAVAVLMGWAGLNAYRIGLLMGEIRMLHGDAARAASEALGG